MLMLMIKVEVWLLCFQTTFDWSLFLLFVKSVTSHVQLNLIFRISKKCENSNPHWVANSCFLQRAFCLDLLLISLLKWWLSGPECFSTFRLDKCNYFEEILDVFDLWWFFAVISRSILLKIQNYTVFCHLSC